MKQGWMKKLLPHLIAVVTFLVVALFYCRPALQGNVLNQSDVTQWKAMAKNSFDYKEKHGHLPLWTNSMFSGMPAYQIAIEADNPVSLGIFYNILRLGLPKPISFFFLASICFYILSQVLRINPYIGIIGGLAYAYVTYHTGIIEAGHDTKMQSIAMMPAFIGSLILLYEGKYLWGAALTALFTAMLIAMNHFQIVYYALIIAAFMTIAYLLFWVRNRNFKHVAIAFALAVTAGAIGVLTNAVTIFTTLDASKTTIRGGTELPAGNATSTGLDKDYALSYSMYKTEPLVMMVPNIYGGSGSPIEEKLEDSKAMEALQFMPPELANQIANTRLSYWGGIGPIAPNAPAYIGAIICFLALVGFFILDNRHKWWVLATTILSVLMSWGIYFEGFNTFLLNNLPYYNKFRVPSMIIVIPTLLFCMMAVLALQKVLYAENREELWDRYKKGLLLTAGIFIVLILIYFTADYTGSIDKQLAEQVSGAQAQVQDSINNYLNALKDDRKSLLLGSIGRSFFFAGVAALMLWLSIRKKIQSWIVISVIGLFALIDILAVDSKYLNEDNYSSESEYETVFTPTPADHQIMQDKSYYRVFDLTQGITSAMPSYFHHSIVGYHPAKLSIYQDLIEYHISKFPQSMPVINMLNTKYIIQADQSGQKSVYPNPDALGPAWFVANVRYEKTPKDVMNALGNFQPADTAIVFEKDRSIINNTPGQDSAVIQLLNNDNDEVTYRYSTSTPRFAVFSEVFYNLGWKAYVDGKELPIIRTNYVLRGLSLPAGQNKEIRFVFHPDSFYNGKTISLVASILVILLLIGAVIQTIRSRKSEPVRKKAKA